MLLEPAYIEFHGEVVAGEAAERVDDDNVERFAAARGDIEHALQLWAIVISTAQACIHKLSDNLPAACGAESHGLLALIGNRQIDRSLSA